jgi:hypothetical protein
LAGSVKTDRVTKPVARSNAKGGRRVLRAAGKSVVRAYGWATADLRPLPDFLLIGAKRSGSTSLFRYLLDHPQVSSLFPSARILPLADETKGVHYFDRDAGRSARWYRSHFPTRIARRGRIVGEASPYYLFRPGCADHASVVVPDATLLVVLRDPVERAWSHWKEQTRNGVETLPFADAIESESTRIAGVEERLRADPTLRDHAHEHLSYRLQGEYVRGLRPWVERFGRDRLHVVWSADLFGDPEPTFARVCAFLGIPPVARDEWEVWNAADAAPIEPALEASLREHYEPLDRELAELVGEDPPWLAPRREPTA